MASLSGEFGNVYKGELKRINGETFSVAVKTLKVYIASYI